MVSYAEFIERNDDVPASTPGPVVNPESKNAQPRIAAEEEAHEGLRVHTNPDGGQVVSVEYPFDLNSQGYSNSKMTRSYQVDGNTDQKAQTYMTLRAQRQIMVEMAASREPYSKLEELDHFVHEIEKFESEQGVSLQDRVHEDGVRYAASTLLVQKNSLDERDIINKKAPGSVLQHYQSGRPINHLGAHEIVRNFEGRIVSGSKYTSEPGKSPTKQALTDLEKTRLQLNVMQENSALTKSPLRPDVQATAGNKFKTSAFEA